MKRETFKVHAIQQGRRNNDSTPSSSYSEGFLKMKKNVNNSLMMLVALISIMLLLGFSQYVEALNGEGVDVSKCTYQSSVSLGSTMTLKWNVLKNPSDASNYILEFGLICTKAGYCSIGFDHPYGQGMQSIDTLFAFVSSGVANVQDCYCTNKHSIPTIDSNNGGSNDFLETNGGVVNGQYHYRWSRKMSTGDSQDATFKNSNVYVSWAYHSSSTSISSTHTDYGRNIAVNFLSNTPTETYVKGMINNGASILVAPLTHKFHLYALAIGIASLIMAGLIVTYLPTAFKSNIITHFLFYRKISKVIPYDFPLVSYVNQFLDLTIGEVLVIIVYLAMKVVWFVYGFLTQTDDSTAKKVASGFTQLIVFNYIFLFIPVTRYSVLQALFGISFERSIKFHKWIGVMVFLSATAHGIVEFIAYRDNIPYIFSVGDGFPLLGIIAWLTLGLLLLFSLEPIRRKLYELFLVFHIPLTFITVTFSIIHGEGWINLLPYMAFSLFLMVVDFLLRAIIGFGVPTKLVQISYDEDAEVTTCVFEKRFLTLFHNPNHAHFVFVYIPQVSIYQLHPMTIKDPKRTIVFIVAGIGATPANAILTALEDPKYNEPTPYKVFVNFTMRNEALLPHLTKIIQQKPNVESSFYITGSKSKSHNANQIEMLEKGRSTGIDHSNDRRFIKGSRPVYEEYLHKVKQYVAQSKSKPYVSVFACGPAAMMNAVHNAVISASDMDCRFELHKEEFEF
ncbi:predicted protein [Naegleria gruberi]|uniref:Predicted protein n=1 Tax=Naegleria gruberi TaxID=5762 RepID=D2VJS7_NAEGR|nr:uncharacterized protein NAEGRDRAFT_69147 [Naegleria gruberi]EFC43002.1 predicted protein [Naegleria gruberi]|eukprot:XP_002675746.1 predicted protein [Naegleria gruberi strain NEG-M]